MTFASLVLTAYWSDPLLARDLGVLVRCGRVQATAVRAGDDTPAGWFAAAARTYPPADERGRLGRRAMALAALSLREMEVC